ncbi:MAG: MFS transporter [Clostridia bacterium]|nr:MFS transporter [Clostridia bacterium]
MRTNFKYTVVACYIAYLTQALVINFTPLLYVTFQTDLGLTLSQISLLIAFNFGTQMLTDIGSSPIVERIGHRTAVVLAHVLCSAGMVGLAVLPRLMADKFLAIAIATVVCGVGGGLIEVMVSPIMEACPTEHKSAHMSLLHSFYCWGHAGVVLLSTLLFSLFGLRLWPYVACLWALIPLCDVFLFAFVPIRDLVQEGGGESRRQLLSHRSFLMLMGLMFCAGAAEITMAQWASGFAEAGLGVPKAMGDLLGPCLFALLMGSARLLSAALAGRVSLYALMGGSSLLCVASYLIAVFAPHPVIALLGCALCGLSVGVMWPGTFSLAAEHLPRGGFPMFAILAFCGDLGCMLGPTASGQLASLCGGDMRVIFLFALIFPIGAIALLAMLRRNLVKRGKKS